MHKNKGTNSIRLIDAICMGIGAMLGAGIFALLGQAGAVAYSAVYISFILGGFIALLSGYSFGKLGVRYPSSGGIVEYLVQGFGKGTLSGGMSVTLYISALISLSLIAKAFGSYASAYLFSEPTQIKTNLLGIAVVTFFMLLNLRDPKDVTKVENFIVIFKIIILVSLGFAGIFYIDTNLLSPSTFPSNMTIASSIGITFFAYEGFRVITNTAEEIKDVKKNLPLAMFLSILIVMSIYILLSVTVFGNLPLDEIISAKDYALAEVAKPIFGSYGFKIIIFTALISTASAINANLYAVTNVTYQMAINGELPSIFAKPIAHSKEGLIITSVLVILLMLLFDLEQTAVIGSISILFVHSMVHIGHLKIISQTQASKVLISMAFVGTMMAIILISWFQYQNSPAILLYVFLFILAAFLIELLLVKFTGRVVKNRINSKNSDNNE